LKTLNHNALQIYCHGLSLTLGCSLVPNNFALVGKIINQALRFNDQWHDINDNYRCQSFELGFLNFAQRWIVVWSKGALERAVSSLARKAELENPLKIQR